MTNKKRKGFTIVELVIVIAVIAILAGVLIPTFTSIIDKANQSTDIQAVRQMNVLLKAESVENEPTGIGDVINIVAVAGYDTVEKRTPKSNNHGFYWHSGTNTIILVKTTNPAELIYPLDNEELRNAFEEIKANWANNHDGFEDLAVEGGGSVKEINGATTDLAGLIAGGGKFKLTDHITLVEFVTVPANTTATLDLNGHTLTVKGPSAEFSETGIIDVSGELTFEDFSDKKTGNIILEISEDLDIMRGVITVFPDGTLNLNSVTVTCKDLFNIDSNGTVKLDNANFIVNCGYGVDNKGTAEITNGSFIAAGEDVCFIQNNSGTMSIEGTTFDKEGDKVSYMSNGPIEARGGELNLNKVNVTTGGTSDMNVYCSGGANVNITGGLFDGKFNTTGVSYIYISGDTQYSYKDENGEITIKAFQGFETSEVKEKCCSSYVPEVGTLIRVIKCTYKDDNDNSVTTFILHNDLYALDGLAGIKAFEGTNANGLNIPSGSVVVFDNSLESYDSGSNRPETELTQNMSIEGTLEINGGNFYAGTEEQKENNIKNTITVFDNGTLVLNAINYGEHYQSSSLFLAQFLGLGVVKDQDGNIISVSDDNMSEDEINKINKIKFVTIKDGGQVYIDGSDTAYTPSLTE